MSPSVLVQRHDYAWRVTLTCSTPRNTLTSQVLSELSDALEQAEQASDCCVVVLEGQHGYFCSGMDFREAVTSARSGDPAQTREFTERYMQVLRRIALMPKVVIASVDGQVVAGGVGLAAACDLVVATPRSTFALPEALWGLLPAMVIPYLIRRTGYQVAYTMTLTTLPLSARDALAARLVDEVSEEPHETIRCWGQRLCRIEGETIHQMKRYFREMWVLSARTEETAVSEATNLMLKPKVLENIERFVNHQLFPWERRT